MNKKVITRLNSYTTIENLENAYKAFFEQLREHAIKQIPVVGRDDMIMLELYVELDEEKSNELLKTVK